MTKEPKKIRCLSIDLRLKVGDPFEVELRSGINTLMNHETEVEINKALGGFLFDYENPFDEEAAVGLFRKLIKQINKNTPDGINGAPPAIADPAE